MASKHRKHSKKAFISITDFFVFVVSNALFVAHRIGIFYDRIERHFIVGLKPTHIGFICYGSNRTKRSLNSLSICFSANFVSAKRPYLTIKSTQMQRSMQCECQHAMQTP